jgi:hypothetical protein
MIRVSDDTLANTYEDPRPAKEAVDALHETDSKSQQTREGAYHSYMLVTVKRVRTVAAHQTKLRHPRRWQYGIEACTGDTISIS